MLRWSEQLLQSPPVCRALAIISQDPLQSLCASTLVDGYDPVAGLEPERAAGNEHLCAAVDSDEEAVFWQVKLCQGGSICPAPGAHPHLHNLCLILAGNALGAQ